MAVTLPEVASMRFYKSSDSSVVGLGLRRSEREGDNETDVWARMYLTLLGNDAKRIADPKLMPLIINMGEDKKSPTQASGRHDVYSFDAKGRCLAHTLSTYEGEKKSDDERLDTDTSELLKHRDVFQVAYASLTRHMELDGEFNPQSRYWPLRERLGGIQGFGFTA